MKNWIELLLLLLLYILDGLFVYFDTDRELECRNVLNDRPHEIMEITWDSIIENERKNKKQQKTKQLDVLRKEWKKSECFFPLSQEILNWNASSNWLEENLSF